MWKADVTFNQGYDTVYEVIIAKTVKEGTLRPGSILARFKLPSAP